MDTKAKGDSCENIVADYLRKQGHTILARNYPCRYGEIDILSSKDGVLCVTEVKSQSGYWDVDQIQYQVDNRKMYRLRRTLEYYLTYEKTISYSTIRFDVAVVRNGKITYYKDAF